ncbi:MAG: hypothetical protein CMF22_11780 [Idiomarinaceae bacterium]|nr:hypothetical protein [Idiomarinaceae bacterium]|tara:strand:+ start:42884 stop:43342 length:459 start_codon:yes stop_codon:yes gene_type:complete
MKTVVSALDWLNSLEEEKPFPYFLGWVMLGLLAGSHPIALFLFLIVVLAEAINAHRDVPEFKREVTSGMERNWNDLDSLTELRRILTAKVMISMVFTFLLGWITLGILTTGGNALFAVAILLVAIKNTSHVVPAIEAWTKISNRIKTLKKGN